MFPLPEKITVWHRDANDGFGGITWSSPIELDARTADKIEKFTDLQGNDQMSKAVFYTDGDIRIGDRVYFGQSVSATPEQAAEDVKMLSSNQSSTTLQKAWL